MTGSVRLFPIAAAALAAAGGAGCLDVAPIEAGASLDGSAGAALACRTCYEAPDQPGPGCTDELMGCLAEDLCMKAFQCANAQGCFQGGKKQLVACGLDCARQVGIKELDDPAIVAATQFFGCLSGPCGPICFPGQ